MKSLFILILSPTLAFGWSLHYLVTDRALSAIKDPAYDKPIAVEDLETFLKKESKDVKKLLDEYDEWFKSRKPSRFRHIEFQSPTEKGFLIAARLNPNLHFQYVKRLLPGEKIHSSPIPWQK